MNCGQTVKFRHIQGRVVPLGCDCDSEPRKRSETPEAFCRKTECPKCYSDVFFIRHNGGSVWLDNLGWPWPRHGCFLENTSGGDLTKDFGDAPNPRRSKLVRVGITEWWEFVKRQVVGFELPHENRVVVFGIDTSHGLCKGTFGLLNVEVATFTDTLGRTTRLNERFEVCKYCNKWSDAAAMTEHIAKNHPLWTCPFCKTTVEARFRGEHERVFNCARPRGRWT